MKERDILSFWPETVAAAFLTASLANSQWEGAVGFGLLLLCCIAFRLIIKSAREGGR